MNIFYPVFVILSVIVIWSYKGIFGKIFGLLMFLSVVGGSFILGVYSSLNPATSTGSGTIVNHITDRSSPYTKLYLSTVVNSLAVDAISGSSTITTSYDIARSLQVLS